MLSDLDLDKENEILFRLGIIYKQQMKYSDAIHCFDNILRNPPSPLAHADIWFQIGHVYEQQKDVSPFSSQVAGNHGSLVFPPSWSGRRMLTKRLSWIVLCTPKCFSNSAGFTIRMNHLSRIKMSRFNISPRVSKRVSVVLSSAAPTHL